VVAVGLLAVVLATVNMVGGFVVTDRMLEMFKGPGLVRRSCTSDPTWAQIGYLVSAVCFIVALKALSSPRSARSRQPDRRRGCGARGDHHVRRVQTGSPGADPDRARDRHGRRRGRRRGGVQMTQMPQLVALFNGVGGGRGRVVACSSSARSPRRDGPRSPSRSRSLVGAVSFSGSVVTFAKLQELMTTRPVTLPGLPVLFVASPAGGVALASAGVGPARVVGVLLCLVGLASASCWCCRWAAPTYRSSSRC
jgi:NAD(P) transhydrogenase subunit beta